MLNSKTINMCKMEKESYYVPPLSELLKLVTIRGNKTRQKIHLGEQKGSQECRPAIWSKTEIFLIPERSGLKGIRERTTEDNNRCHHVSWTHTRHSTHLHMRVQITQDHIEHKWAEKDEEDITLNEQLNLDHAHQAFLLRPTALLSIPWGLTIPRDTHSLLKVCWGD